MPPHHAIHLGAAWEPPSSTGDGIRLVRRFGRPSGIGPRDRVLLVVAAPMVAAAVTVNESPLPSIVAGAARWEHDITPLLRDRNELALLVAADAADAGVRRSQSRSLPPAAIGTVTIEIVAEG